MVGFSSAHDLGIHQLFSYEEELELYARTVLARTKAPVALLVRAKPHVKRTLIGPKEIYKSKQSFKNMAGAPD